MLAPTSETTRVVGMPGLHHQAHSTGLHVRQAHSIGLHLRRAPCLLAPGTQHWFTSPPGTQDWFTCTALVYLQGTQHWFTCRHAIGWFTCTTRHTALVYISARHTALVYIVRTRHTALVYLLALVLHLRRAHSIGLLVCSSQISLHRLSTHWAAAKYMPDTSSS